MPTILYCGVSLESSLEVLPRSLRQPSSNPSPWEEMPGPTTCVTAQVCHFLSSQVGAGPGLALLALFQLLHSSLSHTHTALGLLAQICVWRSPGVASNRTVLWLLRLPSDFQSHLPKSLLLIRIRIMSSNSGSNSY